MSLNFGPAGTLYFMKERDRFDQSSFPFVKIGIVKGDADVNRREKEHQTGNPRAIYNYKEIASPAVQMLETFMHNFFAPQRIKGEWFRDAQLDDMITKAEKMALELQSAEPHFTRLPGLDDLVSNEHYNPCGVGESNANADRRSALEISLKGAKSHLKSIAERMVALRSDDFDHIFKKSTRKPKTEFQGGLAKKLYPDLHKKYVEEAHVWKRVWANPAKQASESAESTSLPEVDLKSENLLELHDAFLKTWSMSAEVEWELSIIEARLFSDLGTNETLKHNGEVVLAWERKSSSSFNKEAFIEAHPEEASQCMKSDPGGDSYSVAEWKSYA